MLPAFRSQCDTSLCRAEIFSAALCGLLLLAVTSQLSAQVGGRVPYYQPLNQRTPPGVAGSWTGMTGKVVRPYFQPVRVELPAGGRVTFYNGSPDSPVTLNVPSQAALAVGEIYRLKISHLPDFPGVELYPSVEVLDRLYPPAGKKAEFPVPIELTPEEIELALEGQLVTKVVYAEQPQLAIPESFAGNVPVQDIPPDKNLVAEADQRGRPMLLIRLGSRLPSSHGANPRFFGSGAPVVFPTDPGKSGTQAAR